MRIIQLDLGNYAHPVFPRIGPGIRPQIPGFDKNSYVKMCVECVEYSKRNLYTLSVRGLLLDYLNHFFLNSLVFSFSSCSFCLMLGPLNIQTGVYHA